MPTSKAQVKATNKYIGKAYDRLNIFIPKGLKSVVEAHAEKKGDSVNGLVNHLLREDMGIPKEEWKRRDPPGEGGPVE